jgi:hypothetical protein
MVWLLGTGNIKEEHLNQNRSVFCIFEWFTVAFSSSYVEYGGPLGNDEPSDRRPFGVWSKVRVFFQSSMSSRSKYFDLFESSRIGQIYLNSHIRQDFCTSYDGDIVPELTSPITCRRPISHVRRSITD